MEHGGYYYMELLIVVQKCIMKKVYYHYIKVATRMIRFMFLAGITFTIYERVKWILGWQDDENDDIDGF